jgi:hypothetical protein
MIIQDKYVFVHIIVNKLFTDADSSPRPTFQSRSMRFLAFGPCPLRTEFVVGVRPRFHLRTFPRETAPQTVSIIAGTGGGAGRGTVSRASAKNGWPREAKPLQCPRRPLDTCPGGGEPIAEAKWFPRSYRAENGGTKQRLGSVPARNSSPVLALRATPIPSVRGLRRMRRNENSAGLRIDLHESNRVAYPENMGLFLAAPNLTRTHCAGPATR